MICKCGTQGQLKNFNTFNYYYCTECKMELVCSSEKEQSWNRVLELNKSYIVIEDFLNFNRDSINKNTILKVVKIEWNVANFENQKFYLNIGDWEESKSRNKRYLKPYKESL